MHNTAYSLAFTKSLNPATIMELGTIYQLKDRKPEEQHANDKGEVSFFVLYEHGMPDRSGTWMSCHWSRIPDKATHWHMCYDHPPAEETGEVNTAKAIDEASFQALLKREFPEPTVNNLLIESTLRKFYFHD